MSTTPDKRDILAAAEVITPSLQGDAETQERVWENFLYFFGDLDADAQRKLSLLVTVLRGLSRVRYLRAYPDLPPGTRHRFFAAMETAFIPKLQAGFNALRSLLLMATYTEPSRWPRIGYEGPTVGEGGMTSRE
jgi:hypothetical protein